MAGSIIKTGENSWVVSFGKKGLEGSIFERFNVYKDALKFWNSQQELWKDKRAEGTYRFTPDSRKVRAYLEKLKPGSRIHVSSIAEELNVSRNVVDDQISLNFKNKFKRSKRPYDTETRRAFTKDGIKFEPKLFKYKNKQGVVKNQYFYQDATTGEWKVQYRETKGGVRGYVIESFKTKDGALQFKENREATGGGNAGKLRRYLDEAFIKNKGKKLTFASLKDVAIKAGIPTMLDTDVSRVLRFDEYTKKVKKFPHQLAAEKPLNKIQIDSIKKQFGAEQPKGGWDFRTKTNPDGFKYGVSPGKLQQRIKGSLLEQPWRYGFSIHRAPGAWMLTQMDRAGDIHGNPKYESIFNKAGKVIGVKEDGVAYYANRKLAPSNASKLIQSHPQFEQIQKIVDIAGKANEPLILQTDKASKALVELFPKGFDSSRVSLSRLLSYLYEHKGLDATRNAINLHHMEPLKALGSPIDPSNIQPLRRDWNTLAEAIDKSVRRHGDVSRVSELKEAGARIKVGDIAYGGGTLDPTKLLKQETEALREPLGKFKAKDWGNLQTWLKQNLKRVVTLAPTSCQAILKKQTGGIATTCIEAINKDPVGSANKLANMEATSGALGKVKTAAGGFLKMLGRGGLKAAPLAALAAVGAGIEPLVKQFRIDDPTTYLTDESQMKGMLLATIEGETPKVDEEILKWQYPGIAAGAATAVPGSKALYKARTSGIGKAAMGAPRAALGPVGKVLAGTFSPLAVAATLPLKIAAQRAGGTDYGDIATDPTNWMGPAFASAGADWATKGMKGSPRLANAIRLGFSPNTLRVFARRFGIPGLAVSAGMWGYDKWKNRSVNDED